MKTSGCVSILFTAFAGACGGGGSSGAAAPHGATCAEAGDAVFAKMASVALDGASDAEMATAKDNVAAGVASACTEDQWSPDQIGCFTEAATADAIQTCAGQLSEAQMQGFGSAMREVFESTAPAPAPGGPDNDGGAPPPDSMDPDDGSE